MGRYRVDGSPSFAVVTSETLIHLKAPAQTFAESLEKMSVNPWKNQSKKSISDGLGNTPGRSLSNEVHICRQHTKSADLYGSS